MQKDELKWWINFEKLLRWIENRTGGEIIDAYYYVGEENPPDTRQQGFLTALADIGYSIITKELKIIVLDDGREIRKANLDIELERSAIYREINASQQEGALSLG